MTQPIIPWIGGKRRLAQHLLPLFPEHTCYVEPFCGAAALFFLKTPAKVEVLNDINGELVTLYRCVQHHLEEFVRQFKWALASREMFKWAQQTPPAVLTDIQRAARFYYLQHQAFGGRVSGQSWGTATTAPPVNLLRIEESLSMAHLRLASAYVEHLDWAACIERYDRPHTLFYCDPPYWGHTDDYGKDIFSPADFERLRGLLGGLQGRFILSLNDRPEVRELFAGFAMEEVALHYGAGGGQRPARELIISG